MLQNTLVILFVAGAVSKIIYYTWKLWLRNKSKAQTCGGCSQCELKKTIVSNVPDKPIY